MVVKDTFTSGAAPSSSIRARVWRVGVAVVAGWRRAPFVVVIVAGRGGDRGRACSAVA